MLSNGEIKVIGEFQSLCNTNNYILPKRYLAFNRYFNRLDESL